MTVILQFQVPGNNTMEEDLVNLLIKSQLDTFAKTLKDNQVINV